MVQKTDDKKMKEIDEEDYHTFIVELDKFLARLLRFCASLRLSDIGKANAKEKRILKLLYVLKKDHLDAIDSERLRHWRIVKLSETIAQLYWGTWRKKRPIPPERHEELTIELVRTAKPLWVSLNDEELSLDNDPDTVDSIIVESLKELKPPNVDGRKKGKVEIAQKNVAEYLQMGARTIYNFRNEPSLSPFPVYFGKLVNKRQLLRFTLSCLGYNRQQTNAAIEAIDKVDSECDLDYDPDYNQDMDEESAIDDTSEDGSES